MKRKLSLLLLAALATFALCAPLSLAQEAPVTLTWFQTLDAKASASMQSMDDSPTWQLIQEKLNIDIVWQHPAAGQEQEQFNLMIASRELPDIIYYTWTSVVGGPAQLIDDGLLLDLTDVIPDMAPNYHAFLTDPANAEIARQVSLNDGRLYIFAKVFPDARSMSYNGLMIRQDWLDALGLERPDNIAQWETVLTAFKEKDPNGNGTADELPFLGAGINGIRSFAPAWGVRNGLYPSAEDGKIVFGQLQSGYKAFLETMADWYAKGLIDPEFAATDSTSLQNKMTQNLGGAFNGATSGGMGRILNLMADVQPDYNLTGVAPPATEEGIRYSGRDPLVRAFVGQGAAISAETEHLEDAIRLLDFCYSQEGNTLLNWGIEGVSYVVNPDGSKSFTETITNNPDGLTMDQAVIQYAFPSSDAPVVNDYNARKQINYALWQQEEASQIWADCDYSLLLPVLFPTAEDSSRLSEIMSEINTYVDEMETKFVMGRESFEQYDAFIDTIYSMGIEEAIEIQQRTYDDYLNR